MLIGTAHVSEKSVAEVKAAIRNLKPDIVAVELCRGRYDSLKGNVQEDQVPIKDILSEGKIYYYVIQWLLAYMQKKIGDDMGVKPGAEMLSAIEEAETIGANVALIDRDIQVTLQRFWGKMKFLEKIRMIGSLLGGLIGIGKGNDIDIDQITEQDVVTALVSELRGFAPTAAEVLIDERDAYLAGSILKVAAGGNKTVVVVIGAGHKPGVINYLKNPKSIPPLNTLMEIPKKRFRHWQNYWLYFCRLYICIFFVTAPFRSSAEDPFDSFRMLVHYHRSPECGWYSARRRPSLLSSDCLFSCLANHSAPIDRCRLVCWPGGSKTAKSYHS